MAGDSISQDSGALITKKVISWAFYDWANSAFALSVLAVLFPLFLGSYWSVGDPGTAVTSRLTWATAVGSIIVSLMAPVLGAIADSGGYRKRFLFVLTIVGAVSTAALGKEGEEVCTVMVVGLGPSASVVVMLKFNVLRATMVLSVIVSMLGGLLAFTVICTTRSLDPPMPPASCTRKVTW